MGWRHGNHSGSIFRTHDFAQVDRGEKKRNPPAHILIHIQTSKKARNLGLFWLSDDHVQLFVKDAFNE